MVDLLLVATAAGCSGRVHFIISSCIYFHNPYMAIQISCAACSPISVNPDCFVFIGLVECNKMTWPSSLV